MQYNVFMMPQTTQTIQSERSLKMNIMVDDLIEICAIKFFFWLWRHFSFDLLFVIIYYYFSEQFWKKEKNISRQV